MDNASNNDTTTTELARILPTFQGLLWRIRCILHILNLIAKAILAHFTKVAKRTKTADSSNSHPDLDEIVEEDDSEDLELNNAAVADEEDEQSTVSTAQLIHDTGVVKSIRARAIAEMAIKGVQITAATQKCAEGIIPKVSGLARRVHDSSSVLKPEFERLVMSTPDLNTDKTVLSRRVATRWNSEYGCLDDHITLRRPVEALTGQTKHKLSAYRLTEAQWSLSNELRNLLKIFLAATLAFSRKETPLVHESVELLEDIIRSLRSVRDSISSPKGKPISPIIRVAAHSGILVAEKYFKLFGECEVYAIAIVMSPEKKLQWFGSRGWSQEEITQVTERVLKRWSESYVHLPTAAQASSAFVAPTPVNLIRCIIMVRYCNRGHP
ncbi:hypothetical protein BT96DRAFT_961106 [Gymnopus androsaceus JB14]|uniref:hAT-like transposase RNase-H fold domain-containing protein n=1 Tax=Gymnopus androsaceus JB14 TaxID=1447944 RepID=A0A6A4GCC5_9AGAR|nr:hypothetical protein BT96DRAFT_961106 [Gymnopus androsaceus JB14]